MGLTSSGIGITLRLVVLALAVVSSALVAPRAQEKEKRIVITATAQSSFFTAAFSFDGESPANYAIYAGSGNRGRFTGQGVSQSAPIGGFGSCTLPDGTPGIKLGLVGHVASSRFEPTGDLLFEKGSTNSLIACLDPVSKRFHEEGTVTIVGGTGAFAGATGIEKVVVDGGLLEGPLEHERFPASAFGFATGTFTFDFTVPK